MKSFRNALHTTTKVNQNTPDQVSAVAPGVETGDISSEQLPFSSSAKLQRVVENPRNLTPQNVIDLQRSVGNKVVLRLLGKDAPPRANDRPRPQQASTQRAGTINMVARQFMAGQVQRGRIENPHAQPSAHEGWDTTAHHILPYSKLEADLKNLKKNDEPRYKAVLKAAIPTVLTNDMLKRMKAEIADTQEARAELRAQLVSDADENVDVGGAKLGDMRESFFLWQGGNQFQGPNTSIRPEPAEDKDGIDFDGKYFTDLGPDQFKELTDLGGKLGAKPEDTKSIGDNLIAILNITRDIQPKDFNPDAWVDISSVEELVSLHVNKHLGRSHLLDYTYFKMAYTDLGKGTLAQIKDVGAGEFNYGSKKIPVYPKGTWRYIKLTESKEAKYTAKGGTEKGLKELVEEKGVETRAGTGSVFLKIGDIIKGDSTAKKKVFTAADFPDQIPAKSISKEEVEVVNAIYTSKVLKKPGKDTSLYEYLVEGNVNTSTFLPKALYDELKTKAVEEEAPKGENVPEGELVGVGH